MAIHPSLSASLKGKQRSILKRAERIKYFQEKGLFNEDSSVYGLPKIKVVKLKIKKEKAEKPAEAAAGAEAKPAAAAETAKSAKPAKAAAAKPAK